MDENLSNSENINLDNGNSNSQKSYNDLELGNGGLNLNRLHTNLSNNYVNNLNETDTDEIEDFTNNLRQSLSNLPENQLCYFPNDKENNNNNNNNNNINNKRKSIIDIWCTFWRQRALDFCMSWFSMPMGIGITSNLLYGFAYSSYWLERIAYVYWGFAIAMFIWLHIILLLTAFLYPKRFFRAFIVEQAFFWGCQPMALSSIINFMSAAFGEKIWCFLYILYWINLGLVVLASFVLAYFVFAYNSRTRLDMNPIFLLPIVSLIVVSTTGATIYPILPEHLRSLILVISILCWAAGEFIAYGIFVILLYRFFTVELVPQKSRFAAFIPLGFLGQGSFSIMLNARNLQSHLLNHVFNTYTNDLYYQPVITLINYLGAAFGLYLVGAGTLVIAWAFLCLFTKFPKSFSSGWWGITFPIATYSLATMHLGIMLDSTAFKVYGCIWAVFLAIIVVPLTFKSIWVGIVINSEEAIQYKVERQPDDPKYSYETSTKSTNNEKSS